jgi:hypothetical protein
MGDGFWTEAWNPRMPDSCLFSSPLAIELVDSDQRGWRYDHSRHLHVLLTFDLHLTCQLSTTKSGGFIPDGSSTDVEIFHHGMCRDEHNPNSKNNWHLVFHYHVTS